METRFSVVDLGELPYFSSLAAASAATIARDLSQWHAHLRSILPWPSNVKDKKADDFYPAHGSSIFERASNHCWNIITSSTYGALAPLVRIP